MVENEARDGRWFEMVDVIANTYGNSAWTLLWRYDVVKTGNPNSAGYEEEIFRIRTLLAPLENIDRLIGGHFLDFDPDETYATVDSGNYCKPNVYYLDSSAGFSAGEYHVFNFYIPGGPEVEPVVSQDMIVALRLVRKNDEWIRPEEHDIDVIRVERDVKSKIREIKIRTEMLKDYLCARGMGLYIEPKNRS